MPSPPTQSYYVCLAYPANIYLTNFALYFTERFRASAEALRLHSELLQHGKVKVR